MQPAWADPANEHGESILRCAAHPRRIAQAQQCQAPAPGYDRLPERRFQFVPLWGMAAYFIYAPRRLECPRCGIHVEHLPWALGKRPVTLSFAWAKLLSWQRGDGRDLGTGAHGLDRHLRSRGQRDLLQEAQVHDTCLSRGKKNGARSRGLSSSRDLRSPPGIQQTLCCPQQQTSATFRPIDIVTKISSATRCGSIIIVDQHVDRHRRRSPNLRKDAPYAPWLDQGRQGRPRDG
jgi:hypothetical protein